MKRIFVIFLLLSKLSLGQTVDSLDIYQCFKAMEQYYPKSAEKEINDKLLHLKLKHIQAEWYPQVDLNMQATYQSDVVEVDIGNSLPFPVDFPSASQDQYKATLDISQKIYDGGVISSSKQAEQVDQKVQKKSVDVILHEVKKQVATFYFNVLLLDKQQEIIDNTLNELEKKQATVKAGVESGTLLPSDLKNIQAEMLTLEQSREKILRKKLANLDMMNQLTGLGLTERDRFVLPKLNFRDSIQYNRPEHELFKLQKELLEKNQSLVKAQKQPKVFAFGQLGYGKPGLNMLKDEFDSFYLVGAKFTWNIWDWNKNKRKRQVLEVKKESVDVQQKTFNKNLTVSLQTVLSDIQNYQDAMQRDKEIISLRNDIAQSARAKLNNGTMTSSEYISEINKLKNAKLLYEQHKIELKKAKMDYLIITGNLKY